MTLHTPSTDKMSLLRWNPSEGCTESSEEFSIMLGFNDASSDFADESNPYSDNSECPSVAFSLLLPPQIPPPCPFGKEGRIASQKIFPCTIEKDIWLSNGRSIFDSFYGYQNLFRDGSFNEDASADQENKLVGFSLKKLPSFVDACREAPVELKIALESKSNKTMM
jgi:hypothetical protein